MRSRLSAVAAVALVALLFQGCDLSPTSPGRSEAPSNDLESVSGAKGKPPANSDGTFDVDVAGGVTGGGTDFTSTVGSAIADLVINKNNNPTSNLVELDLSGLATDGCFPAGSIGPGFTTFRIKQNHATNSPADAEVDYYFEADGGVRYRLLFEGTFNPAVSYWVSDLDPSGDTNTISGAGVVWTVNKVKGKGSKESCATGNMSYSILVTRTN